MARRPITNPLEYLQIALRRWPWILVPTVVITAGTVLLARHLPKLYGSEALILVEPQKVPADFVKPTVSSNVAMRLESIQEQILSRTELEKLIAKYALYPDSGLSTEERVSRMLAAITVTPIINPDQRNADVTAFRINFDYGSPLLAQEVTRDLSALFIAENLKARAQQSQGTADFIDGQLSQAQAKLHDQEDQLRQLKNQYMGSLPEQQSANLQVMGQLQSSLQANAEALARAQQQRTYLTSLGQAVAGLNPVLQAPAPPTPDEQALDKAKADLAVAEQLYTPQHPDVIRLKKQVAALTARVTAAKPPVPSTAGKTKTAAAKPGIPPQQQSQIALLDQEIRQRTADQQSIQKKISELEARIERLPEVEQKLADLTNSYTVAKANYNGLLEKKQAAATAAAMEQQAEGEEFRIVDPANLPQTPTSPNLPRIELMGGMGGLVAGLGLAFLVEMRDPVVRSEADITFYTQVPLLVALPLLPPALALPAAPDAATLSEPVSKA